MIGRSELADVTSGGRLDRDRDVGLAVEDTSDSHLDLPVYLRREFVRRLLETGLRAVSPAEVLIRQRHLVMSKMAAPEIEQAVLLHREELVGQGPEPVSPRAGRALAVSDKKLALRDQQERARYLSAT